MEKLAAAPEDRARVFYRRGARFPTAIAWFGFRSFWGHLWHLVASVIATEDIDSRAWMKPDDPHVLTRRIAEELGKAPATDAETPASITDALDGDLWIDFVADTGDDVSVSEAVASMIFQPYEVEVDGVTTTLPRGDMLLFGGDTAYPVATELEIKNRVIAPFNQILAARDDGKPRVLMGIPGNHDWYAGLDGFGRMFRARRGTVDKDDAPSASIDRAGNIGHFIDWVEAFRVGKLVGKRATLPLVGYAPVQGASYFALHLAPGLDLFAADRQLRVVDFDQRAYFAGLGDDAGLVLVIADPLNAHCEPNPAGRIIAEALSIDLAKDRPLVLTGDTHHYSREDIDGAMHVTAGGGGAFLHPTRISRGGVKLPVKEFPGPRASLALALQVPWQIVHGRSGFVVHIAIAALYLPFFSVVEFNPSRAYSARIVTSLVSFVVAFAIGGWRHAKRVRIGALAAALGALIGYLPRLAHVVFLFVAHLLGYARFGGWEVGLTYAVSVYGATLFFGSYLMLLTIFGLEQHQAFAALAHPGFKHFVRVRVKRDGSGIDGWTIGRVDPLSKRAKTALVDVFHWKNPKHVPRA